MLQIPSMIDNASYKDKSSRKSQNKNVIILEIAQQRHCRHPLKRMEWQYFKVRSNHQSAKE